MDGRVTSLVTRMSGAVREMAVVDGEIAYIRDPSSASATARRDCKAMLRAAIARGTSELRRECQIRMVLNEVYVNYTSFQFHCFFGDVCWRRRLHSRGGARRPGMLLRPRSFAIEVSAVYCRPNVDVSGLPCAHASDMIGTPRGRSGGGECHRYQRTAGFHLAATGFPFHVRFSVRITGGISYSSKATTCFARLITKVS